MGDQSWRHLAANSPTNLGVEGCWRGWPYSHGLFHLLSPFFDACLGLRHKLSGLHGGRIVRF